MRQSAAESRAGDHRADQHPLELDIDAVDSAPSDLGRRIQAMRGGPDQSPFGTLLKFDGMRRRLLPGGGVGQIAIIGRLSGGLVDDPSVDRLALVRRHIPARGRRMTQHLARDGADATKRIEERGHARAPTGVLHAGFRIGVDRRCRGRLSADILPIALEFLGDDHWQRGQDALTHLRDRHDDRHGSVGGNAQPRIDRPGT